MDRSKKLGTKYIPHLLAQFAIPSIASLLLHAFYNVADRIFISRGVGTLGLSAVTLCFPVLLLIFGICMLFSGGAASLISIYLGERRQNDAEKVLGVAVYTITIIGFVVFILGQFYYKNLLNIFNIPPDVLPFAQDYLKVILSGTPLFLYGFTLTFIIRAEGNPLYATLAIVIGTFINLILNPLFIFIFSMGTGGAALATVISESAVALMGIFYMTRKRGVVHVRRKNLKFNFSITKSIMFLGLSPAFMNIASSVQCAFLNERLLFYGGNIAVAAMGIIFPIASMINLFTFGMAAGMQPIIGYNYGAGNKIRVRDAFMYACKINLLVVFFFVVLIILFAENLISLFSEHNKALVDMGTHAIRIFILMSPFAVINILAARYFQAIGKGFRALFVGFLRQIFIFVPMLYLLSNLLRLDGIWLTGPVTDFIAATFTILLILSELRLLSKKE